MLYHLGLVLLTELGGTVPNRAQRHAGHPSRLLLQLVCVYPPYTILSFVEVPNANKPGDL